ncbi:MAG: DUF4124 domain-containing protein [Lysobacter sp.]|nr:DUF4124 domain-containing protein [Lysobacter sp.]
MAGTWLESERFVTDSACAWPGMVLQSARLPITAAGSPMFRSLPRTAFAAATLATALALCLGPSAAALAGDVYTWKDANGVTHYSQTPPQAGSSNYRMFVYAKREGPKTEASAENQQCATARSNAELLKSGKPLRRDTNGDGKPDADMPEAERAQQLELAQMVLRTSCAAKAPTRAAAKP